MQSVVYRAPAEGRATIHLSEKLPQKLEFGTLVRVPCTLIKPVSEVSHYPLQSRHKPYAHGHSCKYVMIRSSAWFHSPPDCLVATQHVRHFDFDVDCILGLNGWVWIAPTPVLVGAGSQHSQARMSFPLPPCVPSLPSLLPLSLSPSIPSPPVPHA